MANLLCVSHDIDLGCMKQVLSGQSRHELCSNCCSIFLKGNQRDNSGLSSTARSITDKCNAGRKNASTFLLFHSFENANCSHLYKVWRMPNVHSHARLCFWWKKNVCKVALVCVHGIGSFTDLWFTRGWNGNCVLILWLSEPWSVVTLMPGNREISYHGKAA